MEVRCQSCNKLFRVSDDKITGTGIKFPCTRCGKSVKITREEFEQHSLSKSAVSVLDMFEPKPKPPKAPLPPEAIEPVAKDTDSSVFEAMNFDLAAPSTSEQVVEKEASLDFEEPVKVTAPAPAIKPEPVDEFRQMPPAKPEPLFVSKTEQKPEAKPESMTKQEPKPLSVPQPEAAIAQKSQPPAGSLRPTTSIASQKPIPAQPATPKKEATRPAAPSVPPAAEQVLKEPIPSSKPSHTGRMILVLLAALIIAALVSYGIYIYLNKTPQKGKEEAHHELTSIEGLRIASPAGAMEANGDLLITGAIENTTDKERPAWYIVTEVYDAQGTILSKIRFLNGKQIFTRRDYDILAKRGENVQELKTKYLQENGTVIPPMGTVSFEIRYLQPQAGIASFNVLVQPFDPVQLFKEIAEEIK